MDYTLVFLTQMNKSAIFNLQKEKRNKGFEVRLDCIKCQPINVKCLKYYNPHMYSNIMYVITLHFVLYVLFSVYLMAHSKMWLSTATGLLIRLLCIFIGFVLLFKMALS